MDRSPLEDPLPRSRRQDSEPGPRAAAEYNVRLTALTTGMSPLSTQRHNSLPAASGCQTQDLGSPGPISSCSLASEFQFSHPSTSSDMSGDRVFPIRSVVSVEPTTRLPNEPANNSPPQPSDGMARRVSISPDSPSGLPSPDASSGAGTTLNSVGQGPRSSRARGGSGPLTRVQADASRHGSAVPLTLNLSCSDNESETGGPPVPEPRSASLQETASITSDHPSFHDQSQVTTRFTYVQTEEGHSVITGRDGFLQRCEDEPIHTPGAIQRFGALLAMREDPDGCFSVRYVSENSDKILGYSPARLFALRNFLRIFTEDQQDNLLDHIDFIRDEDADPAQDGPEVFSISLKHPKKRKFVKMWCAIHINPSHPDLIICEFEPDDDGNVDYPLRPLDENFPDIPQDTLQSNPTREDIEESTEVLNKPLRILRSARKRRGEQGVIQVFDIMSQVQEQLASATSLSIFLKILVGIIKELTGFHRVMIYQFDSSFNGKVVTELVDTCQTMDLYKGLHFPASDIPRQARDLYRVNKVRLLYDRELETARIVCRTREELDTPLDMTHAYLRAMSPVHIKYLANMAVRSSMSISINAFNELWGLIACHSYGSQGMRVSFPIRKMCRLVGDTASRNIERLSYASRLQARKLINTAPTDVNPSGYIISTTDDLLKIFDAEFGLLSIQGGTKILGAVDQSQEVLVMLEYLRMRRLTSITTSQDIRDDFPDLRYAPGFQVIAGLLYVPLSVAGQDFIVFFRKGQVKEVKWAGNPYEKTVRSGTDGYLEPRASFKIWREIVTGKCRSWNEEQVETAATLCLVYGKFIEVWRQKEAALQNSKLTQLLLANSAHEVRTPLNAIINYLELALEGSLDQETRDNLSRSHSASKSLVCVINDLLDLTKAEQGRALVQDEVFDLRACFQEATDPFRVDTERKGIAYVVTQHPGIPRFVHGDGRRVRQAITNVTANAVQHTDRGSVEVEAFVTEIKGSCAIVEIVVADSGVGMSPQQLDSLFCDLEQVSSEEPMTPAVTGQGAKAGEGGRNLGLGLAVVARTVKNMNGQLRLKSMENAGSRFAMQLPFQLVGEGSEPGNQETSEFVLPSDVTASTSCSSQAATAEGEIMLISRSDGWGDLTRATISGPGGEVARAGSYQSIGSNSSHRSEADRLIDAIRTPLTLSDSRAEYFSPHDEIVSPTSQLLPRGMAASKASTAACSSLPAPEVGLLKVRHSRAPIRAVRIGDEYQETPPQQTGNDDGLHSIAGRLTGESDKVSAAKSISPEMRDQDGCTLRMLVAEDDPINMKILKKRLEKNGHSVHHAVNGEDCAALFLKHSAKIDAILMDMQMPIVDGLTSTKMIRSAEDSSKHAGHSHVAAANGQVPIFAVSASLIESQRQAYMDAGFDGWILKPIDFRRLEVLLTGIRDRGSRDSCLYRPGQWERGGWFASRKPIDGAS